MNILPDDIKIKNPYPPYFDGNGKADYENGMCDGFQKGQQSILSQVKTVDIDKIYGLYTVSVYQYKGTPMYIPFSKFLQWQLNLSKTSNSSKEQMEI